ncbi:MAG TPA: NUDIX hydrolase [Streptomyces sp.]|uniref:NUDIX hydrolase n=1 Tax=Streptomyces sp. TaxID=1931 RepID=UPI002D5BA08F|nr:NUDIX hydrolase [Streptomyces sp.]HZG04290.1 NUDIX hydrolase [Streptomyces sp.]
MTDPAPRHRVPTDVRTPFSTPWLTVREALTGTGAGPGDRWYYLDHPGCALVLPVTEQGEVLLVRSWRIAVRQWCVEAPAGRCEPGETPEQTARRELREETGAHGGTFRSLGSVWPSSGTSNELVHLFVAHGVRPGPAEPDPGEVLHLHPLPVRKAVAMAAGGELRDAPTALALLLAEHQGALDHGGGR